MNDEDLRALHQRAYSAIDRGALGDASRDFETLLQHDPDNVYYHYMRGLAHKYLRDWPTSLSHNLRAIELDDEKSQAQLWNAAIAATGMGNWPEARKLWAACGISVPDGEGSIEGDYGIAVVRLNPWHGGETVFTRRIDPARARLLNVPLLESGHRFGDIVLHDGAVTGHRFDGQHEVPVFNELARLIPSDFQTFVAFVSCESSEDLRPLLDATAPGIGYLEDWTESVRNYCMRCSYGAPHRHQDTEKKDWQPDRDLGIASQSRKSIEKLLGDWAASGRNRYVQGIETREVEIPSLEDGHVWWRGPEDDDAEEGADA